LNISMKRVIKKEKAIDVISKNVVTNSDLRIRTVKEVRQRKLFERFSKMSFSISKADWNDIMEEDVFEQ